MSAWLIIPLMFVVGYEVVMRHFFNSPTAWGYDVSWMLFAAQFLLGGAFTHLRNGHIRIDIVYSRLTNKAQLIYDFLINLFIILPPMILFGWVGTKFAYEAFTSGEKLSTTNWFFPAWFPKLLIPIGFSLLALQCINFIVCDLQKVLEGRKK